MKKVLLAAFAGLCVIFMATTGSSYKQASPKFISDRMISDTIKDTTTVPKFVMNEMISDTTKDTTNIPKYELAFNGRN